MDASYPSRVVDFRGERVVPAGPLPAGRHALTREVVLASQRGRLLDAMAGAVAEHGYGGATVAHVVGGAGVSRKTFYEHFADKEDAFLALYDTAIAYVLARIVEATGAGEGEAEPRARIAAGLEAFLAVLAEEPAMSRAIVLEAHAAGPRALARRRAALEAFAGRYEDINAQARARDSSVPELSPEIARALVGGVLELVAARIEAGETARLGELAGPLTGLVTAHVAP
jgi:AcrR family transcriptional regulator